MNYKFFGLLSVCVGIIPSALPAMGYTPAVHKQDFSHNGSVMLADGFLLYGDIFSKWASLGGVSGPLGQPTSDERPAANGGRYNNFQYGFIYWTPQTGAHAVYGLIGEKWNSLGRERGPLGYPLSDELPTANGGRCNNFQYGYICWTPQTGAHAVYGIIGQKWNSLGREGGRLGYPVSDELPVGAAGGRVNNFQNGSIYWAPGQPATVVFK